MTAYTSNQSGIRQVAVLGAGVMGAQIAAHMANAGLQAILFELPGDKDPNEHVKKALASLKKLKPAPLASKKALQHVSPANYKTSLELLKGCQLIIEAVAEREDIKESVYNTITPYVSDDCILASNTSGLSIQSLAAFVPEQMRPRFCGVHFFNPPRYMHLVEVIPAQETDPALLDRLEGFLTTIIGKGVIRAKDTPNFIANRVGVFSMIATMLHTENQNLGFDTVDALTGPRIGRAKSATYRTADVVGLDTFGHVVNTMTNQLPDDPWHSHYQLPEWFNTLVKGGALGQKTRKGIFWKKGRDILVLNRETGEYQASEKGIAEEVADILKIKNPAEKFKALIESDHPQAQFLWAIHRDIFHYCAYHLADIADNTRDVDLAIRWGFGWSMGPFELWQAAGWEMIIEAIEADIVSGKTLSNAPLPAWIRETNAAHSENGSWNPSKQSFDTRSTLPVYQRQIFKDALIGERSDRGQTLFEDDAVRCWVKDDDIALLSFKTKMHTVSEAVLDGIQKAIDIAEASHPGLVIWQPGEPFSAGADLSGAMGALQAGKFAEFEAMVEKFQRTSMKIRYSNIPVVVGLRGLALGGGCEFTMHSDKAVAALETYIGLVEAGVGLLPAGGGLKEAVRRTNDLPSGIDKGPWLNRYFETIAMAKVASSALEAKEMGLLRESDTIVFHSNEVLHVAKHEVIAMAEAGYRAPLPEQSIRVQGRDGVATIKLMLVNMLEGHFISEHDYEIASRIAEVLHGGDVDRNSIVDEEWLLKLERKHFVELAMMEKTQARIMHTLKTGKPLRN
ncbi:MAG: 3-hydroxyacyl-CoA dehydrogenase/enoyl-CoA hydratase family protein [bacterium]